MLEIYIASVFTLDMSILVVYHTPYYCVIKLMGKYTKQYSLCIRKPYGVFV